MEIDGKTAIVTGGARGIGRAISRRIADEGGRVIVVDIETREGQTAARELRDAVFVRADVTREDEVEAMVDSARELGGLDILVNNAGGYSTPVFPDAPVEHWSRTLDLNLRAVMLGIQFAVPAMAGGGAIVNVASSAALGHAPHPGPEYAVAKAGVMRLTECLAPLAERGIRVNCVCPHTVGTEAVRTRIAELESAGKPVPEVLAGTLLTPEEIAEAMVELVRDETLAGRVLICRGGRATEMLPSDA
jgi:NAD(P)-dependent dehydrogenase (short-subunit alcohol dehydrogenase family)